MNVAIRFASLPVRLEIIDMNKSITEEEKEYAAIEQMLFEEAFDEYDFVLKVFIPEE